MSHEQQKSLNVEATSRTSEEIVTRVRKLRWAGMDEEAERLLQDLERQPARRVITESVLPTRLETD